MYSFRNYRLFASFLTVVSCLSLAQAGGVRITIPKRSEATPVQKLNREGVKQIQHHHLAKAERLFYKAYLIDPDDPFTLNNLGYISELQGKIDRAQRYYELAAKENNSETVIALASARHLEGHKRSEDIKGKTVAEVAGHAQPGNVQINILNVEAISLLNKDRVAEADAVLQRALRLEPRNPFTLNNLGFTMESQGDLESALRYYNDASLTHSSEPIVVSLDPRWRGKPISDIAFRNEQAVRARLASEQSSQDRAARLHVQGVSALNHNNEAKAYEYFQKAYRLDPQSSFSLNNMGFVSEAHGDKETASEFYSSAQRGEDAGVPVSIASHHEMVGAAVGQVAGSNAQASEADLQAEAEAKRRMHAPIILRRRDNTPVTVPQTQSPQSQPPSSQVPRPPMDNAPVENTVPRPPQ